MADDLKPCPFCGGPAIYAAAPQGIEWATVRCTNCYASIGARRSEEGAAKDWNTRADAPELAELRAALRKIREHGDMVLPYLPHGPGAASVSIMRDIARAALGETPAQPGDSDG